jgi:co-chaperonin GroES (HSP10)|tara:strand:- start:1690 stop:1977 length:288 start_codon:yes stop_codon:yes gene_type:complete
VQLEPKFARVLVKRQSLKETLKTSLEIPEEYERRNAPNRGTVIAVGETCEDFITALMGKTIIFGRHAGDWIDGDEEDTGLYILQEEDILAEIRDD